jgi:NTE family protein
MTQTVALVLGSGGARGYTHIGVIDEIESRGYKVVSVSGCSMGAIVGGFYSAGKLEPFRQWATSLSYMDVIRLVDFSFISKGAIRGDKVFNLLAEMLDGQQIEDLQMPFTAVATDLVNSKEVWFQRGSLEQAIRASAAIPSLIKPVEHNGKIYVDGGVLNPLPIAPSVSAHADHIIAVDLNSDSPLIPGVNELSRQDFESGKQQREEQKQDWFDSVVDKAGQWISSAMSDSGDIALEEKASVTANLGKLEILYQMFEVMQASLSQYKIAGYPPDLLVRMPQDCCEIYEFHRAQEMIDLGREVARQALDAYEQGHSSLYGQRLG